MHQRGEYLRAMGIDVWVRREVVDAPSGPSSHAPPAAPAVADAGDRLDVLAAKVSRCELCELHRTRTHTVFGSGCDEADWMFVGEAPGAEEDRRGLPFVGRAGKLLDAMLHAVDLKRDQVYIANVLKCRPPNNRDPMGDEVKQCESYLHQQVDCVKPRIIIALGRFAAQSLLKTTRPIGKLRGEVFSYADTGIPLVVSYHPAYLLRNPIDKRKTWEDLMLARKLMENP